MNFMNKFIALLMLVLLASCSTLEKKRFENANVYINCHLKMSELNRIALLEGMIILGMNPCESIASVGEPYLFHIIKKGQLTAGTLLHDVTASECSNMDGSVIILFFRDSFQYGKVENYSVVYKDGFAVKIERGAIPGKGPDEIEAPR